MPPLAPNGRGLAASAIEAVPAARFGDLTDDVPAPPAHPPVAPPPGEDPAAILTRYRRSAFLGDILCALVASVASTALRFDGLPQQHRYILINAAAPLAWVLAVSIQRGYEHRFLGTGPEEYRHLLNAGLLLFTMMAVASFSLSADISRQYALTTVPVTVLLTLMVRHLLRDRLYRKRRRGLGMQRVLIVGRADAAVTVIEKLHREPQHGLVAVGVCIPRIGVSVTHVHGIPVVGDPDVVLQAVDRTGAHVVAVVSHPDLSGQALRRLSWALEERQVELIVSPGIIEVAGPRLSIRPVAGLSLLHMESPSARGGRMLVKAVFDRVIGMALLILAAPLMVTIACAIRLSSSGPVLFRQTRIGVGGRKFTMLKFRSMVVDAEARRAQMRHMNEGNSVLFKMRSDPRVTRVGGVLRRLSLDELPQLLNVVFGHMSLVGPRPPLPEEVEQYSADAVRRLRVRPGLTGLWQISGRSDLSWEESLNLDLRYVDNWSIPLDISILWRTGKAVVTGLGAY